MPSNPYSSGAAFPNMSPTINSFVDNLVRLKTHQEDIDMRGRQLQQQQDQFNTELPIKQGSLDVSKGQLLETGRARATAEEANVLARDKFQTENPQAQPWNTSNFMRLNSKLKLAGIPVDDIPFMNDLKTFAADPTMKRGDVAQAVEMRWPEWAAQTADSLTQKVSKLSEQAANLPENDPKRAEIMKQVEKTIKAQQMLESIPADKIKQTLFPDIHQYEQAQAAATRAKMGVNDWVKVIGPDGKPMLAPASENLTGQAPYIENKPPQIRSVDRGDVVDIYENGVKVRTEKKGKVPGATSGLPEMGAIGTGAPGDRNDGALQGLTPAQQQTVKAIAEYRFPVSNLRNKEMMGLVQRAYAYDPTFDAKEYAVRAKVRSDFTSGKSANNIKGLNTAVGHIDSLVKASADLANGNWTSINEATNILSKYFPVTDDLVKRQGKVAAMKTKFNAVKGEMASIFKQTGATDQEIKSWESTIDNPTSATPEMWKGFVGGALELMGSRLTATRNQYEVGLGKPKDFRFLSDNSLQILKGLGADIDAIDPVIGGGPAPTPTRRAGDVKPGANGYKWENGKLIPN